MDEKELKAITDKLRDYTSLVDTPLYNLNSPEEFKLEIRIDNNLEHGEFMPSKVYKGLFYATEQTFKAMKKDIFVSENLDDTSVEYVCESCSKKLDKAYWNACPFCMEKIH